MWNFIFIVYWVSRTDSSYGVALCFSAFCSFEKQLNALDYKMGCLLPKYLFLLTKLIPIMNTIAHNYWQACFVCISVFFYTFSSLSKAKLTKTLKQQMLMVPTASAQLRAAVKVFAFSSKWLLLVWLMDPEAVADAVSQIRPCLVRGQHQTFWSVVENCCLLLASVLE